VNRSQTSAAIVRSVSATRRIEGKNAEGKGDCGQKGTKNS